MGCPVWSVKFRVESAECKVYSAEGKVQSVVWGVPSVNREVKRCRGGRCHQCHHSGAVSDSIQGG